MGKKIKGRSGQYVRVDYGLIRRAFNNNDNNLLHILRGDTMEVNMIAIIVLALAVMEVTIKR